MNKKAKFLLLPVISILSLATSSCGQNDLSIHYDKLERSNIDDNYLNFYQIFPVSFADSDGNGKGDLQGVIDKLDYIYDMGYNGIWLNPIHPSSTDHHYDVEDYFAVAPTFGTLSKFDNLVTKCHEKGIKIILDMVLNHSSAKNEWFTESYVSALTDYKKEYSKWSDEAKRYNWQAVESGGVIPQGYAKIKSSDPIAYEAQFDSSMPDFNLQQLIDDGENSELAVKFKEIFKFWLIDHKVDGFRFDAVTQFFTGDQENNLKILTWMNNACRALKPKCYLVGEGNWSSNSNENKYYQASGFDSFFQFANSVKNTGYVQQAIIQQSAKTIYTALTRNEENADGGIEAPFLGNHDVPRFVGGVQGRGNARNTKFALGLLQMLKGATFTYYGDELGMASQSTTADGWYRLPIRWGDDYSVKISKLSLYGVSEKNLDEAMSYPFATVKEQLSDSNSVLNYAKQANLIRLAFPEIARGSFELVYNPNNAFAIIKRTYKNSSIYVVINASLATPVTIDYTQYGEKIVAELSANEPAKYESSGSKNVIVPAQGILIIK